MTFPNLDTSEIKEVSEFIEKLTLEQKLLLTAKMMKRGFAIIRVLDNELSGARRPSAQPDEFIQGQGGN